MLKTLVLLLFLAAPGWAGMVSIISGQNNSSMGTAATNYYEIQGAGGGSWLTAETRTHNVVPDSFTLDYLRVKLGTAPGAAASNKSWTFTLRKNVADTALQCTIFETATSCSDTTNSVSVVAGDKINLESGPSSTAPNSSANNYWALRATSASNNTSLLMQGTASALTSNSTQFLPIQGDAGPNATETNRESPIPTNGSFDNMYVDLESAPGGTQIASFTLVLNGLDTSLTCQVSGTGKTCNDTTHSVNVVVGDTVSYKTFTSATATGSRTRIGVRWNPTTDGESLGFGSSANTVAQGLTRYNDVTGAAAAYSATEATRQSLMIANTLKKLYANVLNVAAVQTSSQTVRINAATTGISCTVTGGVSATCSDSSTTYAASDDDLLALQVITSALSGTVTPQYSLVYYVAPAVTASVAPQKTLTGIGQ